jgi:membrane protease YdiL (CAAX protease family)
MGMLCRVVILWIVLSLGLSFLFAFLKNSYFTASMNTFVILHTTIMDLVGAVLIVWTVRRAKGHWRDLGFHLKFKEILKEIGVGLLGYLCILPPFFVILILLVLLARLMAYEPPPHPLVEIFLEEEKRAPVLIGFSIFLGSIVGPILEELFFRGFCYPILRRNWGKKLALVLTALFFAFIHQNEFAFIPIFILGIGLGLLYEMRQNLIAPIAMHIVHNCFFMSYFFAAKRMILSASGG